MKNITPNNKNPSITIPRREPPAHLAPPMAKRGPPARSEGHERCWGRPTTPRPIPVTGHEEATHHPGAAGDAPLSCPAGAGAGGAGLDAFGQDAGRTAVDNPASAAVKYRSQGIRANLRLWAGRDEPPAARNSVFERSEGRFAQGEIQHRRPQGARRTHCSSMI